MATVSRFRLLNDVQWELISGLLPSNEGRRGHPFGDDRRVVEGIIYRYRTGVPWRDLPRSEFGPWQTGGTTSPLRRRWHLGSGVDELVGYCR